MRRLSSITVALLLASGCGDKSPPTSTAAATPPVSSSATAVKAAEPASDATSAAPAANLPLASGSPPAAGGQLAARAGELTNPDGSTMVFIYHDLAGIKPPIDEWVEKDNRVAFAPGLDKAAQRTKVKAELESGFAAVRNVGSLRLSLSNAGLSDYDPTYGEFTIQALSPSSVITFDAFQEKVTVQIGNGRAAQTWKVAPGDAQAIRDKVGHNGVSLNVLLKIRAVQPGLGGGTITADVVEYELRESSRSALTIGRVKVSPQ